MSCCGVRTIGGVPVGAGGSAAYTFSQYELNFAEQPDQSLASGTESIDGHDWEVSINGTDTLDVVAGSGLQYVAGPTTGTFTGSTFTATHLYLDLAQLYAILGCDMRAALMLEIYASVLNLTGTGYLPFGLWGQAGVPTSSGSRIGTVERAIASATQVWRGRGQLLGFNYQLATNVWGLQSFGVGQLCGFTGPGGPWPDAYVNAQNVVSGLTSSLRDSVSRLAIAFATNGTAGTMTATIERIRATALQPVLA